MEPRLHGDTNDATAARRFVLLSKTEWTEPPRLRHQVAELLMERGHEVFFGERPGTPFRRREPSSPAGGGPVLFRHTELLHHKLRGNSLLRGINAAWTARSLRRELGRAGIRPDDVILNFNYDYCFLRDVAPRNPVVTVINDDFISTAPAVIQPALYRAQDLTCASSDAVLCTSPVVAELLRAGPEPELFLPWASEPYRAPAAGRDRNVLLFWGYMGRRLDVGVVRRILEESERSMPDLRIRFVGPKDRTFGAVDEIERLPRVEFQESTPLDRLRLDDVVACFIPYVTGVPDVDAIVFPNKIFQMLGVGQPMVISGMPHFIRDEFVFRVEPGREIDAISSVRRSFDAVQPRIRSFLSDHGPDSRYRQLMRAVDRATAARASRGSRAGGA